MPSSQVLQPKCRTVQVSGTSNPRIPLNYTAHAVGRTKEHGLVAGTLRKYLAELKIICRFFEELIWKQDPHTEGHYDNLAATMASIIPSSLC